MEIRLDPLQLLGAIADAVIVADPAGRIVFWNPGATRIFGFSADQALGQPLSLITPERLRNRHDSGFDKSMQTGTTRYGTTLLKVPALHRDGHTLSIAFTVAMLFDADHRASGVVAVIRDETARYLEERELRRRLAACEAELAGRAG